MLNFARLMKLKICSIVTEKREEIDLKWSYLPGDFDLAWGEDVLLESRESSTAKRFQSVAKGELQRWLM